VGQGASGRLLPSHGPAPHPLRTFDPPSARSSGACVAHDVRRTSGGASGSVGRAGRTSDSRGHPKRGHASSVWPGRTWHSLRTGVWRLCPTRRGTRGLVPRLRPHRLRHKRPPDVTAQPRAKAPFQVRKGSNGWLLSARHSGAFRWFPTLGEAIDYAHANWLSGEWRK
jgi:hypothetical protein